MALGRSTEGDGPVRPVGATASAAHLERRRATPVVAVGTLACPACDAPVMPHRPLGPAEDLSCPVCAHGGHVRDFLTLGAPTRPARVVVRITSRGGPAIHRADEARPRPDGPAG